MAEFETGFIEFKGLILATTVWYGIFAGSNFGDMRFFNVQTDPTKFIYNTYIYLQNLFIIPITKKG